MLQDVEFFSSRLGKIVGFGDAGDFLTDIIKSKEVEAKKPEPVKVTEETEAKDKPEDDAKAAEIPATETKEETKEETADTKDESKEAPSSEEDGKSPPED